MCATLCALGLVGTGTGNVLLLGYPPVVPAESLVLSRPASLGPLPPMEQEILKAQEHARLIKEEADLEKDQSLTQREEVAFSHHYVGGSDAEAALVQRARRLTRLADQVCMAKD
jgi:hypothetical protein